MPYTVTWNGFNTEEVDGLLNQIRNAIVGEQASKKITTYRKNHAIKPEALTIKFNKSSAML